MEVLKLFPKRLPDHGILTGNENDFDDGNI